MYYLSWFDSFWKAIIIAYIIVSKLKNNFVDGNSTSIVDAKLLSRNEKPFRKAALQHFFFRDSAIISELMILLAPTSCYLL